MEPWTADPGSWQDMGDVVDDWMGEPAGGMGELDDNLRALDSHADLASFGGGPYPQMQDVDGDYAADGSRFNATVGDASEAAEPRAPPFGQTSPPRQPWSVPGQPAEPHPDSAMWLAPATLPGGLKQQPKPRAHRAQSSACAVSPTASGANASPSKPSRPARQVDIGPLLQPARTKVDMTNRLAVWCASKSGGHCTVQTEKVSSGSRRIVRLCTGKDCSFKLVAARGKGAGATWSVSFESSVLRHHSGCCSFGDPSVGLELAGVPAIRNQILSAIDISQAHESMRHGNLATFMCDLGFTRPPLEDESSHKKACYRLVNRVFGVDQKGIAAGLATLVGWAESFNTANDGHNGKATLVTKPGPVSTEQGTKEQFVSLTVVFAASATLLQYGGARLFACDAAHLKYERKDLRLAVIEGSLANGTSMCLAFSLGWGETNKLYSDLFAAVKSFEQGGLYAHMNKPQTTIITDRGPGLIAAVSSFFPMATHTNCREHLKRNAISKLGNLKTQRQEGAERPLRGMDRQYVHDLVDEVASSTSASREQEALSTVRQASKTLHDYLVAGTELEFWVAHRLPTNFDRGVTTTNIGEGMFGVLAVLGIRSKCLARLPQALVEYVATTTEKFKLAMRTETDEDNTLIQSPARTA